jgi:FkbM family methyltransferase
MTLSLNTDPAFCFRRFEKVLLMLRFFCRFPRKNGAWPKYEYLKPWITALEPALVVDVGANKGQFLSLARGVWPSAGLIAIEADKSLCEELRSGYGKDGAVDIHCCAAGADDGEVTFHITRDHQNSSVLPPAAAFSAERPGDGLVRTETVPMCRLDSLLDGRPGRIFVKIDVQGTELAVLQGFGDRLDDVLALIVEAPFECAYEGASDFHAIYCFLIERGFAYEGALGTLTSRETGRVRQEDAIFVRAGTGLV